MKDLQIGQYFTSKSKIQNEPVEYIYGGRSDNGDHVLKSTSGNKRDDCVVDSRWFDERKIVLLEKVQCRYCEKHFEPEHDVEGRYDGFGTDWFACFECLEKPEVREAIDPDKCTECYMPKEFCECDDQDFE